MPGGWAHWPSLSSSVNSSLTYCEIDSPSRVAWPAMSSTALARAYSPNCWRLVFFAFALDSRTASGRSPAASRHPSVAFPYDVVKDLVRLERFVANGASNGLAIVLTNDPGYWNTLVRTSESVAGRPSA